MTKYDLNLQEFVVTMSLIIPNVLLLAVPFATFIAVTLYYDRIDKNNELIVFRTLGLRKRQLIFPPSMVGLLSCILSYTMTLYFIPRSNILFRKTIKTIENNIMNVLLGGGNFNRFQNITTYSESRTENEIKSLVVYISSPGGVKNKVIYARSANILDNSHLRLYSGNIQERGMETKNEMKTLFFDEQNIDLNQFYSMPAQEESKYPNVDFMYMNELLALKDKTTAIKGEIFNRILVPILSLLLSALSAAIVMDTNISRRSAVGSNIISYIGCLVLTITFLYSARLAKINTLGFYLTISVLTPSIVCTLILMNRDAISS
jgi:lipopolysaccharide export LptBFGC system permease protein LptF